MNAWSHGQFEDDDFNTAVRKEAKSVGRVQGYRNLLNMISAGNLIKLIDDEKDDK